MGDLAISARRFFAALLVVATFATTLTSVLAISAGTAAAQAGASAVILNEWNAVASDGVLDDGAADPAFGPVLGNGGDWFELVVADPNGVDLRGWTLEISDDDNALAVQEVTDTFVLSQNAALAAVPAGTIITVAEDIADELDSSDFVMNLQANSDDEGDGFTALSQSNFDTNSKNWQLRILDAGGAVIFGPAGEGVNPASGVGNGEVGKLEQDPSTSVTAANGAYNDGTTSTFGAPNVWSSGSMIQDFSALRGVAASPSATFVTSCVADDGQLDFTLTNPTDQVVSFQISISGVDPVTVSVPAGSAPVESVGGIPDGTGVPVLVTAGGQIVNSTTTTIDCDPSNEVGTSQVILNEWNAVAGSGFLDDGAADTRLGRIEGNGGDWFELVVADANGVDLRGWTLTISDANNGAELRQETDVFTFSQDARLAAVPGGTIVTIAEDIADDFDLSDFHMNLQANSEDLGAGFTAASQSNFDTNSFDWQVEIRDAGGALVFGPAGEGVSPDMGIGNGEVGKLERNPGTDVTPLSSAYNDGSSSTFGAPNAWSSSTMFQNFESFWGANPLVSVRPVDCVGGLGIVRVNVTNNYTSTTTFEVTLLGQLTDFSSTKTLTLAAGETNFIGFSGRQDSLYDVRVGLVGAPLVSLDGFANVGGDSVPNGAVVHCGDDDVVVVANVCVGNAGSVYLSVRNDTAADRQFRSRVWYETQVIDDQAESGFGGIERIRTVAAGEFAIETVSGRTQDIGVLMTARQGDVGFAWLAGDNAGTGAVLVDCQGETSEIGVLVSCLAFNGRIDLFLNRPTSDATTYRVRVSGPNGFFTERTVDLIEESTAKVSITGRLDGTHPITVDKLVDGAFVPQVVVPSEVTVSCDEVPTIEVTVRSTCLSGNGRLDVVLGNTDAAASTFVVTVTSGGLTPRTRNVAGFTRSTVTYTGRPDGQIPVQVTLDGVEVYNAPATVACDG